MLAAADSPLTLSQADALEEISDAAAEELPFMITAEQLRAYRENPRFFNDRELEKICRLASEEEVIKLTDATRAYYDYARLGFANIGGPHEVAVISKIIEDCPRALNFLATNEEGSKDKFIHWLLFWSEHDALCDLALLTYLGFAEEEESLNLLIHALDQKNATAFHRIIKYFGVINHDEIKEAIDIYVWGRFQKVIENYHTLLAHKDEDIGWSDIDPEELIEFEENNFKDLAELTGIISLLVYHGYAMPEVILRQLENLQKTAEAIETRPTDDWLFDNPIEEFTHVAEAFAFCIKLDQAYGKIDKLAAKAEFAALNSPAAKAALEKFRHMIAHQLFRALNNLADKAEYTEDSLSVMPELEFNREGFREAVLNIFLTQPIIAYEEWGIIKELFELGGSIEDISPCIHHREHSGPKQAVWEAAPAMQKYVTAIRQPDGKYRFYALPLVTEIEGEVTNTKLKTQAEHALLTTLFYHLKRGEAWDAPTCQELKSILSKLNNELDESNQAQFEKRYTQLEAISYYAECLSDDSEDESAEAFHRQPLGERNALLVFAKQMMSYGQVEKIWAADGKRFLKSPEYDLAARAEIHHDEKPAMSALHDLGLLNEHAMSGTLNKVTLKEVHTPFIIAEYRGIHYDASWSQARRKKHRAYEAEPAAMYAKAVYKKAGLTLSDPATLTEAQNLALQEAAALLHHQLISLEYSGPISSDLSGGEDVGFTHARYALQDFYTKKYDEHAKKCAEVNAKRKTHELVSTPIEVAMLLTTGPENYNCSTGDTPTHACRYAYGVKTYGERKEGELKPRWHKDGKTERPYAGKVYTMLFGLEDYLALNPSHLVSLAHKKEVDIDSRILHERETSFSAFIPKKAIIESRVLRYPNFNRAYRSYYLHKYGMDEKLFNEFKKMLLESKPHSKESEHVLSLLAEHLCAYQEAKLIESARLEAKERGALLIYRDRNGGFNLVPPLVTPVTKGVGIEAAASLRARQAEIKASRAVHKAEGWLHKKMETHQVLPAEHYLEALAILVKQDINKLKEYLASGISIVTEAEWLKCFTPKSAATMVGYVKACFQKILNELLCLAQALDQTIQIDSFLFEEPISLNPGKAQTVGLIYLGGDGVHGLVAKTVPEAVPEVALPVMATLARGEVGAKRGRGTRAAAAEPAAKRGR